VYGTDLKAALDIVLISTAYQYLHNFVVVKLRRTTGIEFVFFAFQCIRNSVCSDIIGGVGVWKMFEGWPFVNVVLTENYYWCRSTDGE